MPQTPQNFNSNQNNLLVNIGSIPVAASAQRPFLLRAIYFPFGIVISFVWMLVAWLLAITVIGLPAAKWMFLRMNVVLTLQRLK